MKVILCEDIARVGTAGDVKKVADGYGRNFLLPRKLAIEATPSNLKKWETDSKAREVRLGKTVESAKKVASELEGLGLIEMTAKVGREGHLFGSVTAQMIAETLKARGITIDKKTIHVQTPIKSLGEHEISIKLHSKVTTALKVNVTSSEPVQGQATPAAAPSEGPAA